MHKPILKSFAWFVSAALAATGCVAGAEDEAGAAEAEVSSPGDTAAMLAEKAWFASQVQARGLTAYGTSTQYFKVLQRNPAGERISRYRWLSATGSTTLRTGAGPSAWEHSVFGSFMTRGMPQGGNLDFARVFFDQAHAGDVVEFAVAPYWQYNVHTRSYKLSPAKVETLTVAAAAHVLDAIDDRAADAMVDSKLRTLCNGAAMLTTTYQNATRTHGCYRIRRGAGSKLAKTSTYQWAVTTAEAINHEEPISAPAYMGAPYSLAGIADMTWHAISGAIDKAVWEYDGYQKLALMAEIVADDFRVGDQLEVYEISYSAVSSQTGWWAAALNPRFNSAQAIEHLVVSTR